MNEITTIVQTVGFPIVAYLLMVKNNKDLTEIIMKLSTTLEGIDTRLEIIERNQKTNE